MNDTNNCSPVTPGCTGNGETTRRLFKTRMQLPGVADNYKF